jgi:hypothetical protein
MTAGEVVWVAALSALLAIGFTLIVAGDAAQEAASAICQQIGYANAVQVEGAWTCEREPERMPLTGIQRD